MEKDQEDVKRMDSAAICAAEQIRGMLSSEDVSALAQLQLQILGRLQDSNAVLSHFNDFSERSFAAVANDFSRNTRLLKAMKVDLDHIFRRIRGLKNRLAAQYPDAFKESVRFFRRKGGAHTGMHLDDVNPLIESGQLLGSRNNKTPTSLKTSYNKQSGARTEARSPNSSPKTKGPTAKKLVMYSSDALRILTDSSMAACLSGVPGFVNAPFFTAVQALWM